MSDRVTPEALDRYLDALASSEKAELDSELAEIARRYLALGQATAPPGARERVLKRVTRQAGPRPNGHDARQESLGRHMVLARPGDVPGPDILWQSTPIEPVRRTLLPRPAWPAFLLLLIGLVAVIAWAQSRHPEERVLVAPAAEATQTTAPTPPVTDGQVLFTRDLPSEALPAEAYGATFDQRTMPPQSARTEASSGPLLFRYLLSGQVQVQADGVLEVCSAACAGIWQRVPVNTSQTLSAGDAVVLRGPASLTWANAGAEPVDMIAWAMTDEGGGNSEAPEGWGLHNRAAVHMAVLEHPEQRAQIVLRRRELAPGEETGPVSGAWLSQFIALDHNAAGETVAPMFGKLPGGAKRNVGRQDLTIYQISLAPHGEPATPAS